MAIARLPLLTKHRSFSALCSLKASRLIIEQTSCQSGKSLSHNDLPPKIISGGKEAVKASASKVPVSSNPVNWLPKLISHLERDVLAKLTSSGPSRYDQLGTFAANANTAVSFVFHTFLGLS